MRAMTEPLVNNTSQCRVIIIIIVVIILLVNKQTYNRTGAGHTTNVNNIVLQSYKSFQISNDRFHLKEKLFSFSQKGSGNLQVPSTSRAMNTEINFLVNQGYS